MTFDVEEAHLNDNSSNTLKLWLVKAFSQVSETQNKSRYKSLSDLTVVAQFLTMGKH